MKFRRVVFNDFQKIKKLYLSCFNLKISRTFYENMYLEKKSFNSFVALNEDHIIGHVGFFKNLIQFENKIFSIYSRHSSMIEPEFRRNKIYSRLCDYSFKKIKKSNTIGIITWPNKINKKVKLDYKYINLSVYKLIKIEKIKLIANNYFKKFNINKKILINNFYDENLYKKNINYINNKYSRFKNIIYLIDKDKNIFIISYKKNKEMYDIYLIDYFTKNKEDIYNFYNKLKYIKLHKKEDAKINFYTWGEVNKVNKTKKNLGKESLIIKTYFPKFIPLKKIDKKILSFIRSKSFKMGDTDSFYEYN